MLGDVLFTVLFTGLGIWAVSSGCSLQSPFLSRQLNQMLITMAVTNSLKSMPWAKPLYHSPFKPCSHRSSKPKCLDHPGAGLWQQGDLA